MSSAEEVTDPTKVVLKVFFAFGGAVAGTLLVRFFLFDDEQVDEWSAAWQGLFSGELSMGTVLGSQTFWICVMGAVIGAGAVAFIYGRLAGRAEPRSPSEVRASRERARLLLAIFVGIFLLGVGCVMAFVFLGTLMAIGVVVGLLIVLTLAGLLFA